MAAADGPPCFGLLRSRPQPYQYSNTPVVTDDTVNGASGRTGDGGSMHAERGHRRGTRPSPASIAAVEFLRGQPDAAAIRRRYLELVTRSGDRGAAITDCTAAERYLLTGGCSSTKNTTAETGLILLSGVAGPGPQGGELDYASSIATTPAALTA